MANMPVPPGKNALNKINQRKTVERWVATNKKQIRAMYFRVAGAKLGEDKLTKLAMSNPESLAEYAAMAQADEFRSAHESYYGEKKPFKSKTFKKDAGATNRSAINGALNFYNNLAKKYDTADEYGKYLGARSSVDEFAATEAGKIATAAYGYGNLVKAAQGIKGFDKIQVNADYLAGINPLFKTNFGRSATAADVSALMPKYATPADYSRYLGFRSTAANTTAAIGSEDLSAWGAGGISQDALQQELYTTQGQGGDLQRRIDEARLKRKNAFTGGQAQAIGNLTEGGQFTQKLF